MDIGGVIVNKNNVFCETSTSLKGIYYHDTLEAPTILQVQGVVVGERNWLKNNLSKENLKDIQGYFYNTKSLLFSHSVSM